MRTLVVGAGAVGGYFGGRLAEAGLDVTFLARPAAARRLEADGLRIRSPRGDARVRPRVVTPESHAGKFDAVLLCVKSYSLAQALVDVAPAIGGETAVVPMLNGIAHLDVLREAFGDARILGGMCLVAAALGPDGEVVHSLEPHELVFGALSGGPSARAETLQEEWSRANLDVRASPDIVQEMWEKIALLSTTAGSTCLMRAALGDILASPGGPAFVNGLFYECAAIAAAAGHPPRPAFLAFAEAILSRAGSPLKASMLADIERGGPTEGEHVLGWMSERAATTGVAAPTLALARCAVAAYEIARSRRAAGP